MKKVLAIILALVICASVGMVAFADEGVGDDGNFKNNTGNTDVNIEVTSKNISVTVPLNITIVADVGGGTCAVPTEGLYKITNTSLINVEVIGIEVSEAYDAWTLVGTAFEDSGIAPTDSAKNEVFMEITETTKSDYSMILANAKTKQDIDWDIAIDGSLAFKVDASSSKLNTTVGQEKAFTVTYTVQAAA